jgi:hypothetical protein
VRDAGRVKDWLAWHEGYDDPSSSLARRLEVVRRRLGAVLDAAAGERRQLLSLCAGDGRDVIPVLAARSFVVGLGPPHRMGRGVVTSGNGSGVVVRPGGSGGALR